MSEEKKGGLHIDIGGLGNLLKGLGIQELLEKAEKLADAVGDEEAKERVEELKRRLGEEEDLPSDQTSAGSGLFEGILDLIDKLKDSALTEDIKEFEIGGRKGVVSSGLNIRTLAGKPDQQEEKVGHRVRKKKKRAEEKPIVEQTREPLVNVYDEQDSISLIVELPSVEEQDINFELQDQVLIISTTGSREYKKEIELPAPVDAEKVISSFKNGMLELKFQKV